MTPQDGLLDLINIIRYDLRPPLWEKTVAVAKEARMYHAKDSEAQREELRQIRKTESEAQENQRVRLTNAITSVVLGPVYSYPEQIWRTDGVVKIVDNDKVPESIRTTVGDYLSKYFRSESLHRYCFSTALLASKIDPNMWTVFEAKFGRGSQGESRIDDFYPVEVMSEEVRGYKESQSGALEYLAFELSRSAWKMGDMKSKKNLSDFYLYAAGFSIHFAEWDEFYTTGMNYEAEGYQLTEIPAASRKFWTRTFQNKTTEVPAIRWSAYLSPDHHRKIGETLVATAIPLLKELLKDNSLLQLTKYLHVYAEKHQYVRRCNHQDENGLECISGYYGGNRSEDSKCKACHGTGKMAVASEQDVLTVAQPEHAEDMFELSKLTHYVERPIDILIQYREMVREKSGQITAAVYNQQNIELTDLTQTKTATGERLEYDKIYDKLSPLTEIIALGWELGQRTAYQYYNYDVKANMSYPFDMKMKSIMDLLTEYNTAKDAGAPYSIIQEISADILNKQHRNNPLKADDIIAFDRWKPWKDKTAEDIALITQSRDNTDPDRVLWENWGQVVEEVRLSLDGIPFSKLPPDEQRQVLYNAAAAYVKKIVYTSIPDPLAAAFPLNDPEPVMPE